MTTETMRFVYALTLAILLAAAGVAAPLPVLFGGNGGHPNPDGSPLSINNGWVVLIDQNNGSVTPVGHPDSVPKISGLAFEPSGTLYASTIASPVCFPPPCMSAATSHLIQVNPSTGALVADIGVITASGLPIQIADLAVQPGSGTLFGVSSSTIGNASAAGNLYTINRATGVATLVGSLGDFFAAIAFAPNGTLYATTADLDMMGNVVNDQLKTLNPATAQTLTAVSTGTTFYSALGVRFTDGVIFGGNGDGFPDPLGSGLFTINATTGSGTLVGHPGLNFVGDLDFLPVPEPATLTICGFSVLLLAFVRARNRAAAGRKRNLPSEPDGFL